ncbi:hypothetical protein TWF481_004847 [Arthrobotrys musiformis]|uniref:Uncharacterized protein n=1 Tax=Arthrobotrys musiformis TaxID=47236 RepID=A0AAV9WRG2_9PEZI
MKTFFTTIILGIFAITSYAREVDTETSTSTHKVTKTHTPTTLVAKTTSTTTSLAPQPTCDVRMFRIDCPETPDPCCTRLCVDASSNTLFCADDWEDVGEGVQCESCVAETTSSSSEVPSPTVGYASAGGNGNVTTTAASIPEPTFSSEASGAQGLRMGGAAAFGLFGLALAIF